MSSDRYHFIPESEILSSKSYTLYQYANAYWVVHPEKGLAFWDKGYSHPQCNSNKEISERLCPDWGIVKFYDRVLVPLNLSDYKE